MAYSRVIDPVKSVVAIENVAAAINQIAQTTLRKVVGQHTLDETLSETAFLNREATAAATAHSTSPTGPNGNPFPATTA